MAIRPLDCLYHVSFRFGRIDGESMLLTIVPQVQHPVSISHL